MLRTSPVWQSPASRTSPRRISPSQQTNHLGERSPSPQCFWFGPFLVSVCICLAGIAVYMWPRVQVVRLAYRMQAAELHLLELTQERDQLRFELASLKDPQ